MKAILISAVLSFVFSGQSYAAEKNHHSHGDRTTITEVKPDKKFIADEALKERMNSILSAMQELNKTGSASEKKKKVVTTGARVESVVQDIFKKLQAGAPDADAAIHPILAGNSEGANLLKKVTRKMGMKEYIRLY
ncbi:MAG: hypothetical protein R2827_10720 [Bdellovibrionales bacterium]